MIMIETEDDTLTQEERIIIEELREILPIHSSLLMEAFHTQVKHSFYITKEAFLQGIEQNFVSDLLIDSLYKMKIELSRDIDDKIQKLFRWQAKHDLDRKSENLCEGSSQTPEEKV